MSKTIPLRKGSSPSVNPYPTPTPYPEPPVSAYPEPIPGGSALARMLAWRDNELRKEIRKLRIQVDALRRENDFLQSRHGAVRLMIGRVVDSLNLSLANIKKAAALEKSGLLF